MNILVDDAAFDADGGDWRRVIQSDSAAGSPSGRHSAGQARQEDVAAVSVAGRRVAVGGGGSAAAADGAIGPGVAVVAAVVAGAGQ